MKRICKICLIEKEIEEFPFSEKSKNFRRRVCFDCYRIERRDAYHKDIINRRKQSNLSYNKFKDKRLEEVKKWRLENPEKIKIYSKRNRIKAQNAWKLFKSTLNCSNCDENHPACLEFHHVNPDEKEGLITKLRFSKKRLEEEMKKCIVLCSNCHRKHHWEEINV